MIVSVAIVEDQSNTIEQFKHFFNQYTTEQSEYSFRLASFPNAEAFLESYQPIYDLVMMDIQLPGINGMDASFRLRTLDEAVTLVFVTNMAQFAVKGYEVDAFDFVVKPVTYSNFKMKIQRILHKLSMRTTKAIVLSLPTGPKRIFPSEIIYIEVSGHTLVYHTASSSYNSYGTLKAAEAELDAQQFRRCNSCYLINLQYVEAIVEDDVIVRGEKLHISRARKKPFLQELNNYLGGNV